MSNKVREVQDYLKKHDIKVSEVAIVNVAIDIIEKSDEGIHTFVNAFQNRKRK